MADPATIATVSGAALKGLDALQGQSNTSGARAFSNQGGVDNRPEFFTGDFAVGGGSRYIMAPSGAERGGVLPLSSASAQGTFQTVLMLAIVGVGVWLITKQ